MHVVLDGRQIQDHYPGVARYAYNLALALGEEALGDITLLYNPEARNTRHDLTRLAHLPRLKLLPTPVSPRSWSEQVQLPVLLRRLRGDVYHSPYFARPLLTRCPTVTTIYDLIPLRFPEELSSPMHLLAYWLLIKSSLMASSRVITLSDSARDDLIRLLGAGPTRIVAIPAGVDASFAPSDPSHHDLIRDRYGLRDQFILHVGVNRPHKNLARLIEAFAAIAAEFPVALALAGKEDTRHRAPRLAVRRLGLDRRVLFLGDVPEPDLPHLYSAAQAFVFPSLYEGFGLPPLEAMACGCPVLCSDAPALPEVVGRAALTFDPQSVSSIAAGMRRLLANPALREDLSARGVERSRQFTWRAAALRTWDVYEKACGQAKMGTTA